MHRFRFEHDWNMWMEVLRWVQREGARVNMHNAMTA